MDMRIVSFTNFVTKVYCKEKIVKKIKFDLVILTRGGSILGGVLKNSKKKLKVSKFSNSL